MRHAALFQLTDGDDHAVIGVGNDLLELGQIFFKVIENLFGARAARAVASGECEFGILLCGTGLGIGLAANKIKGIRCVTCSDPLSAELGRRHNNANMLSMGARIIGPELAKCIARAFLTAQFEGGRHALRVEMLNALERGEEIE